MRTQSINKLPILQAEFTELSNQTNLLLSQYNEVKSQAHQLQIYASFYKSDRVFMQKSRKASSDLNTLSNTIRRNQSRLSILNNKIISEELKIQSHGFNPFMLNQRAQIR